MRYLPVYEHRCPLCGWPKFNGHAPTCKLAALLKGNKAKETRDTIRLIETKSGYECENCGFKYEPQKDKYNFIKYCPMCGKRLEVEYERKWQREVDGEWKHYYPECQESEKK